VLGGWGLNGRRVTNWAQGRDGCLNNVTRKFGMKMKERKGNCPLSVGKGSLVKVKNVHQQLVWANFGVMLFLNPTYFNNTDRAFMVTTTTTTKQ